MAQGLRNLLPLVQLPPRGIWGAGGVPTLTTAESWLGAPLATGSTLDEPGAALPRGVRAGDRARRADLVRRDAARRRSSSACAPSSSVFATSDGRELFDLPTHRVPTPDTPAPPRFLPEYDNALVSHADRRRIIAPEHRERVFTKGTLLVDGFVRGTWKLTSTGVRRRSRSRCSGGSRSARRRRSSARASGCWRSRQPRPRAASSFRLRTTDDPPPRAKRARTV